MAGQTNNDTLLKADNQLILTQNEQTVELNDIEQAILSLKAVIASTGSGGSDAPGGSTGPSGVQDLVGLDVDDDFSPEQRTNRCVKANFIVDTLMDIADGFVDAPLEEGIEMSGVIIGGLAGFYIAPLLIGVTGLTAAATAAVLALIGFALTRTLNFSTIYNALDNNRQFVVNGLYNSKNIFEARNSIIDNTSLDYVNGQALGIMAFNDLLAILFQDGWVPPAEYIPDPETSDCALSDWYYVRKNPAAADIVYCELPGRSFALVSDITTDLIQLVVPDTGLTDILITYGSQTLYMVDTARYNLYINGSVATSNAVFSGRSANCSRTINYTGVTEITSAQLEILHQTGTDPNYDYFYYAISSVVFS